MAAPDLQIQLQAELDSEFHIVRLLGEGPWRRYTWLVNGRSSVWSPSSS